MCQGVGPMQTDDRIAQWAKNEAKSDCAAQDLLREKEDINRNRSERRQLVCGALVVLAFCALSLFGALIHRPTTEVDRVETGDTLAESRYHFRP